jgi:hypothetical protein
MFAQPQKAALARVVTLAGRDMEVRPAQSMKAWAAMVATLDPRVTDVRTLHDWKEKLPIVVTESGME